MPDWMPDRSAVIFSGGGTGGHLYPALALAEALVRLRPDVRPFFIGARRGLEARILPERGVDHLLLPVEGIRRNEIFRNVRVVKVLVASLLQVARLFRRMRPELVVVTGGYASGPAGLVAALLGVRLVVQEQNAEPGITTRALSRWAVEVFLAFPEARARLPGRARARAVMTGNPVRPPEPIDRGEAAGLFALDPERPVLLAVGGSQGAEALNDALVAMVSGIESGSLDPLHSERGAVQLLWGTGPGHIERVERTLTELGDPGWVRAIGYIDRMPAALALADLAVSRAGAMATSEFLAWGIPSILIPLPTAAADHQTRNARTLEGAGAARCILQEDLDGSGLHALLHALFEGGEERRTMAESARRRGRPGAAREMAERLNGLLLPTAGGA